MMKDEPERAVQPIMRSDAKVFSVKFSHGYCAYTAFVSCWIGIGFVPIAYLLQEGFTAVSVVAFFIWLGFCIIFTVQLYILTFRKYIISASGICEINMHNQEIVIKWSEISKYLMYDSVSDGGHVVLPRILVIIGNGCYIRISECNVRRYKEIEIEISNHSPISLPAELLQARTADDEIEKLRSAGFIEMRDLEKRHRAIA